MTLPPRRRHDRVARRTGAAVAGTVHPWHQSHFVIAAPCVALRGAD
jgi:hypothetical protein